MLRRWGPSSPHYVYNTVPTRPEPTGGGFPDTKLWTLEPRPHRPAMLPSVYATTRELGNSLCACLWSSNQVIRCVTQRYCGRIPRFDFRDLHSTLIKRRLFPIGLITKSRKFRFRFWNHYDNWRNNTDVSANNEVRFSIKDYCSLNWLLILNCSLFR